MSHVFNAVSLLLHFLPTLLFLHFPSLDHPSTSSPHPSKRFLLLLLFPQFRSHTLPLFARFVNPVYFILNAYPPAQPSLTPKSFPIAAFNNLRCKRFSQTETIVTCRLNNIYLLNLVNLKNAKATSFRYTEPCSLV
jgi:hypothetical protein